MESKKYSVLKVVQMIFMAAAIVLCAVSLIENGFSKFVFTDTGLKAFSYIAEIIALLFGIVYLAYGCKKNAAAYYKTFMIILAIVQAVIFYRQIFSTASAYVAILNIVPFVMIVVLAICKNLGKTISLSLAGILFASRIIIAIFEIVYVKDISGIDLFVISYTVSDILLAGTAFLMVVEKYIDKDERGTI